MIPLFALIFRARGEKHFGDTFGMIAWGLFTAVLICNHGHTPDLEWFATDFVVVALLFRLGATPGWSRDCWPAWESSDPVVRDRATLASMKRGLWFIPLITYVCARGGQDDIAAFLLGLLMIHGFALCIRWCEEVRIGLRIPSSQQWITGELMLGAWLGFIQYVGVL